MNLYEESSVELWTETPPIPALTQETVHTCVLFVAMATSGSCSTDQANNCAIIIAYSADIHFCSVLFWTSPLCHGGTFNTVSANSKPYVYCIWCVIAWVFFSPEKFRNHNTPLFAPMSTSALLKDQQLGYDALSLSVRSPRSQWCAFGWRRKAVKLLSVHLCPLQNGHLKPIVFIMLGWTSRRVLTGRQWESLATCELTVQLHTTSLSQYEPFPPPNAMDKVCAY